MSVRNNLGQGNPIFESSKASYKSEPRFNDVDASFGSKQQDDNRQIISEIFSEAGANEQTHDKCSEDASKIGLGTLSKKKPSDHKFTSYYNTKRGGQRKVLSWRSKRGREGRNGNHLTVSSNQAHTKRHHFRRWLNEKTEEVKENRSLPKTSRVSAHIKTIPPTDTSEKTIEASSKDISKSELKNAGFLEFSQHLNENVKQRPERSELNSVGEDFSRDKVEFKTVHGVVKETEKPVNKNYDDDDNSHVIAYSRSSSNDITPSKYRSQKAYDSNSFSNNLVLGSLEKSFSPIDVKSDLSSHTQLESPGKSNVDDPDFGIQKEWICHPDESNSPLVSMDGRSEFLLFSSEESALDNNTEDINREDEANVSLIDTVYSDADSKEIVWNQVACDRRQRLLLQMESLAPRSFLLASLTGDR